MLSICLFFKHLSLNMLKALCLQKKPHWCALMFSKVRFQQKTILVVVEGFLQKQPPEGFYNKKVFLEISQISQENTCARVSFLIKLQSWTCNFIKKENLAQVFSLSFARFLRTPFIQSTSGRLLLFLSFIFWKKYLRNLFVLHSKGMGIKIVSSFSCLVNIT